ncbi:MAG: iron-containing alcohol dehydrogenase [Muribaculaceae bacterium]|nr:iron-containing alcohol dehydrogenase [Muribaculaceae bacterium]
MENFEFYTPTEYVFGRGTESRVGELTKKMGSRLVLIVYGGGSVIRSGLLDRVKTSLDAAGVRYLTLGGINPNPTDDRVREGIAVCREAGVDGLLAVGGGSVIDTAKAIAGGVPYDGDFWDFWAGKAVMKTALPVGVVLTIAAAGSEGSGNSVITRLDGMRKISLRTTVLRPRFAVLNPELTFTLPPYQTACGIVDMMAHIMECYFSNSDNCEVTDRLCEGTLKAIIAESPKVMAEPDDYQARANIMWAGTIAHNGICGTGRVEDWTSHAMEHEISALYDVAHGAGLAVVFPAWMTYMAKHHPHKIIQFANRVYDVATAEEGIARHKQFIASIGMPLTLEQLGIENPDLETMNRKLHENKGEIIGAYHRLDSLATLEIYRLML